MSDDLDIAAIVKLSVSRTLAYPVFARKRSRRWSPSAVYFAKMVARGVAKRVRAYYEERIAKAEGKKGDDR